MTKPDMGLKRQCGNCSTKFFDFGRDKIVCPKCGTPFVPVPLPTRSAVRATPQPRVVEEEKEDDSGAETISLEDADAGDDAAASKIDVEAEDDDEASNDTFLEEEEEDGDDVSNLIDGDIETDEEA